MISFWYPYETRVKRVASPDLLSRCPWHCCPPPLKLRIFNLGNKGSSPCLTGIEEALVRYHFRTIYVHSCSYFHPVRPCFTEIYEALVAIRQAESGRASEIQVRGARLKPHTCGGVDPCQRGSFETPHLCEGYIHVRGARLQPHTCVRGISRSEGLVLNPTLV